MADVVTEPDSPQPLVTCADFPQALETAAGIARLSPSSHNCQPWSLVRLHSPEARAAARRLADGARGDRADEPSPDGRDDPGAAGTGTEYAAVVLDRSRQLVALAAHRSEMLLSCGAFTELLVRSLACQGWTAARPVLADEPGGRSPRDVPEPFRALGEGRWHEDWSLVVLLELRYVGVPSGSLAESAELAAARRTHRSAFREQGPAAGRLERLQVPGTGLPEAAPVTVRHLSAPAERDRYAGLVAAHAARDFTAAEAWRETHRCIHRDLPEARRRGDGFSVDQLFGPRTRLRALLRRAALHPNGMRLLRHVGYPRALAARLAADIRATPVLFAFGIDVEEPTAADTVRAGARLVDYWLSATRQGLALHPVSVLVQHEDLRERLQTAFDLRGRTVFTGRLGIPASPSPAAPRRDPSDFTHVV